MPKAFGALVNGFSVAGLAAHPWTARLIPKQCPPERRSAWSMMP